MCAIALTSCIDELEVHKPMQNSRSEKTTKVVTLETIMYKKSEKTTKGDYSDLVHKVAYLIENSPEEWERKYEYNKDCRYARLSHSSGVVITMTNKRKDHRTSWSDATNIGWSFTKPRGLKLTVEENRIIDDAYYGWYELTEKDSREIILNTLNN